MRMIEGFNKTIDYIESVMKDEIDEKRILELSGYSYAMFRRIFSILTETTLSEYIRARKLTEAAKKIRETDEKIIEITAMIHLIHLDWLLRIFMGILLQK